MIGPVLDTICEVGDSSQLKNNGQNRDEKQSQERSIGTVPQDIDEEFTLIHLNDDCLRKILSYLSFYHLNKAASTCTRLQYIARLLFVRFYNNDRLTYKKVKIVFHEDEIRNFGSLAEKIWLHDCKENSLRLMIEENCGETLRHVIFSNLHNDFNCVPGVESIFMNLKELSFFRCATLINMPLDHCTSLTKLECVGQSFKVQSVFPKLKCFRFEYSVRTESTRGCHSIKDLFMKHTNLTEIICHSYYSNIMEIKKLEKLVIRELVDQCSRVSNLQRLNKLKILELGNSVELETHMIDDIFKFLKIVPNPEILVELRLPRLRRRTHGSFHNLIDRVGKFSELLTLKLDMYELYNHDLRLLHPLKKLQRLKLKATRSIGTDALIEWIGHMEDLKAISFYNTSETNLLLDTTEQVDLRLQQMYLPRQQQLTINYLKIPHNNIVACEDFVEDLFELSQKQNPYYLYKSIVLKDPSHS